MNIDNRESQQIFWYILRIYELIELHLESKFCAFNISNAFNKVLQSARLNKIPIYKLSLMD